MTREEGRVARTEKRNSKFDHEAHEGHEGFGNYYISISYFVLFATFVVIVSVSILVAALPRWALRDLRGEKAYDRKTINQ